MGATPDLNAGAKYANKALEEMEENWDDEEVESNVLDPVEAVKVGKSDRKKSR